MLDALPTHSEFECILIFVIVMIIANKGLKNIQRRIGGVLNQEVRFISSDLSGKNKNPVN